MPKSPSTPKSGVSKVAVYDPFFCTQSSANILDSSSPALAPVTPLVLPPVKAVQTDPATAALHKAVLEDDSLDAKAKETKVKELVKILEKKQEYIDWKDQGKFMKDSFRVRNEAEEVRAKMGVAYKK